HNSRWVTTASHDQVRQPMYDTSVGRWKHYETFLTPLTDALRQFGVDY
ncbi:MAG TPA: sulfotransferase, partial [Gammaproteobacteria bacterium]|nr:sulfotransferase [Gammaproteobacteria bacterium]